MPYADFAKNRIKVYGIRSFPEELCAAKSSATIYTFPMCGDILRRVMAEHSDLELTDKLVDELDKVFNYQTKLRTIASKEDASGDPRLYAFQRVGVEWLKEIDRGILADEPGMGKTAQSLQATQDKKKIIVVCTDIKMDDWCKEVEIWTSRPSVQLAGSRGDKEEILKHWVNGYLVMNYTTAATYSKLLKSDALIVDEAHHLRNKKTGHAAEIKKIARKAKTIFLLTATPIINFVDDIWTLLNILDPKRFSSYWSFAFRFCEVEKGYFGIKVGGLKESEIENLNNLLSAYCLRRPKTLLPGNPHRETYIIEYELPELHRELYDQMAETGKVTWQGKTYETNIRIAKDTRSRQLAIHPRLLFPEYEGPSKLDVLYEIARSRMMEANSRPIIAFTAFGELAEIATEELSSKGININRITGKQTKKRRADILKKFEEGRIDVLVVTHKTGGEGLNLVQADTVIYLDLTWHPSGNQQASERIDRPGQKADDIEIIIIHSVDTIEDHVADIVREKNKVTFKEIMKRKGRNDQWWNLKEVVQ